MSVKTVITWFDLPSLDFDRAVKFYSEILGEPVIVGEHMGTKHGFFPMEATGDVGGNILPPCDDFEPSAQGTRVYFCCDGRLDDAISKVEKSGGKIIRPKLSIGEPGWIAVIQDTEGNIVGLHSRK